MEFKTYVFFFLSAILVFASLRVVTARNPVHAALFLVLAFFTASGVWMLLQAEFLAISLVLVYVGAVMVLFLFVVMMLDINLDRLREGFWSYLPLGAMIGLLMVLEMGVVVGGSYLGAFESEVPATLAGESNTKALGRRMADGRGTLHLVSFDRSQAAKPNAKPEPGLQSGCDFLRCANRVRTVAGGGLARCSGIGQPAAAVASGCQPAA